MKSMRIATLAAFVSVLVVGSSMGYTNATFDSYTAGQTFLTKYDGWQANTVTVEVVDSVSESAPNSLYVATDASVSNELAITIPAGKKIWTDFRIRPMIGVAPTNDLPTTDAHIIMYFDSDGFLGIYTNGGFAVCSNDIWGNAVSGTVAEIDAGSFAEIGIFQDYTTHSNVVFVNGVAVMQDIPMLNAAPLTYNYFVVANVESNAWLDDLHVQTNYSGVYTTEDGNGNGLYDVDEAHEYGYLGRTLTIDGGAEYYTFQNAIDTYRELDTIVVQAGSYSENFNLDKDIVLTGSGFTLTGDITVNDGGSLTLPYAVTVTGDVTVAVGGYLNVSNTLNADTLALNGTMDVASGVTLTLDAAFDMGANATGTVNSATIDALAMSMLAGSRLDVNSGTLTVTGPDIDLTGDYRIYGDYWAATPAIVTLPFVDDFEIYQPGSVLSNYTFFGWYTTHTNIKVVAEPGFVGAPSGSTKTLILPDGTTVSNRIDRQSADQIWTTYYICANKGVAPENLDTTSASFLAFVNTNGYMQVYTSETAYVICDTELYPSQGGADLTVDQMASNIYRRVDIHVNIASNEFALFVDGVAVGQQLPMPRGTGADYASLIVDSNDGDAYIDDIMIRTALPPGLTLDSDGNDLEDGYEIHQYGYIGRDPLGALFKFR